MREIDPEDAARACNQDDDPARGAAAKPSGECEQPRSMAPPEVTLGESSDQLRGRLKALRQTLVRLIPELETIRMLIADAGLPLHRVNICGPPEAVWFGVLDEALREGADALRSLLAEVATRYPRNQELNALLRSLGIETDGVKGDRTRSSPVDASVIAHHGQTEGARMTPTLAHGMPVRPLGNTIIPSGASALHSDSSSKASADPVLHRFQHWMTDRLRSRRLHFFLR